MSAQPLAMSITHILTNDKGQTYFVRIVTENPGRLVRELWESMSDYHGCPQSDEEACGEWTDRMREFRTTVNGQVVTVHTHASRPQGDKQELHADVLKFLRERGLAV